MISHCNILPFLLYQFKMPHDDTVSYNIIEYQCINSIFSGGVFDVDISSPSTHPPVLPIPTGPHRSPAVPTPLLPAVRGRRMQRRPAVPVLRVLRREAEVLQQDVADRQVPLDAGVVQSRAALGQR